MTHQTTITREIDLEVEYLVINGEDDVGIPNGSIEIESVTDADGNQVALTAGEEESLLEEIMGVELDNYDE